MALRKTARELKNEAHACAIQLASSRLFGAYGFDRVTVDDICREAQVSKSTFYNLYRSKDDLAMVSTSASRDAYIDEHYSFSRSLTPNELLRSFFQANFAYTLQSSREQVRTMYKGYLSTGNILTAERSLYRDKLYELIDYAMEKQVLRARLSREDAWWLVSDSLIGCFIGWSAHITAAPGLDEQYARILDGLADSLFDHV